MFTMNVVCLGSSESTRDLHVFGNRRVTDGVRRCRDAGFAAIAAATAVEARHVHSVQVIVVLPSSGSGRVFLIFLGLPAGTDQKIKSSTPHIRCQLEMSSQRGGQQREHHAFAIILKTSAARNEHTLISAILLLTYSARGNDRRSCPLSLSHAFLIFCFASSRVTQMQKNASRPNSIIYPVLPISSN